MDATMLTLKATGKEAPRLRTAQIVALHLAPGLLATPAYIGLAPVVTGAGAPPALALLLVSLFVLLPVELGYLLYQGRRRNGRWAPAGVVLYRAPLARRQYLLLVPALLVWSAVSSTLLTPLDEAIRQSLFAGLPDWFFATNFVQNLGQYSRESLVAVLLLSAVLNIAVPAVEELYFRGYLLPRMAGAGRWAPLLNVALFSLYHLWAPWDNPARIVALLPVVYAVWWQRNIYLSMAVHCALNTIGTLGLLALLITRL